MSRGREKGPSPLGFYKPRHPWDRYTDGYPTAFEYSTRYNFSPKRKSSDQTNRVTLTVKTRQGEDLTVSIKKNTRWDWGTRKLTTDCQNCRLFVGPDESNRVVEAIRNNHVPTREEVPTDLAGICTVGKTSSGLLIRKFLYHPVKNLAGCKNPPKAEREQRAKELMSVTQH